MSDEGVTRQVQGVCEAITMRGDWLEFQINIGKNYPVKLSTKKDEIKTMGQLAAQQMAVWTFTEHQGNPNPHKPGEFFKNRYLSNVVVGGQLDPALASQTGSGQTSMMNAPTGLSGGIGGGGMPEGREASIERQTIVKAVLGSTWAFADEDHLLRFLDRLDAWIAKPRVAAVAPQPSSQPPPHTDEDANSPFAGDDIPF